MAVEMIIDHWNPNKRRYRTETFRYGPRACPLYRSGPERKVPGRHGMVTQRKTGWMARQLHAAVPTSEHRVQTAKTEHSSEESIPSIEFLRSTGDHH